MESTHVVFIHESKFLFKIIKQILNFMIVGSCYYDVIYIHKK